MEYVNFYKYRTDEQLLEKRVFYIDKSIVLGDCLKDFLFKFCISSFDDFEDISYEIYDLFSEYSSCEHSIRKIDDVLISRYLDLKAKNNV